MNHEKLLSVALESAKKAGQEVARFYKQGNFTAEIKEDNSPVTSADIAANDILMDELKRLTPDIPIISEEVGALGLAQRSKWSRYWLLDPIDGTGEFIAGSGDFAVNVALVENGWPSIGVIHAPDHQLTYYAQNNLGAFKENDVGSHKIHVAHYDGQRRIKVAISRRQDINLMGQYLNDKYDFDHVALGSCSLKNCLIAEGGADCYLRVGPTGEWDTGASHCIIEQAGGSIIDSEFKPLTYNQRETLMQPDFISLGNKEIPWQDIIKPHRAKRL
ncbi:3'(2'),5'-bisphosphate nucleotidase CysQ [Colwellia sp. Arc7-D]|jgi:3'(2'), 5'-bisphosphate nucleotidase|uniref:3'(2'),5'-bisphosphate nucleotidase CysQ n=1 Tax=Colwellia sp. Arc7-D TaxID=2161872 RepID=UPI000D3C0C8B|nr:3'(2'),5'-bisphosphate nucleotidase CysQ [Colwellia sp. Arc7-D]AWB56496.1 3'(2'),5'-bisphosphate nucleotidase [Colwellia sp. Arc7-D]|tara:strand:- start:5584 stop:6405 length:822 start_codon:yes stop_codon:yes gene_type:complete